MRQMPVLEICLVALCAVAMLFLVSVRYRAQQAEMPRVDTYSSFDKTAGGYAAWYELLKREGVRVGRFQRRAAYLTGDIDTLIVSPNTTELEVRARNTGNTIGQIADVDYAALRDWVRRGGHLVWITDGDVSQSTLGMPSVSNDGPERDQAVTLLRTPLTAGVSRVDGKSTLRAPFGKTATAIPLVGDSKGAVVATYRFGKGRIAIVTDQTLFSNLRIAKADNARLAYDVVTGGGPARGAVIFDEWVHGYLSGETWWGILPAPMRTGLILIGVALLLLVIGSALRFGPTAQPHQDGERTSAEYVASMAALLERGRAARKALRDLADAAIGSVAVAVGLPESADVSAIRSRVERQAGLVAGPAHAGPTTRSTTSSDILELDRLRGYERPTAAELERAAQLALRLRKEYARHGRLGFIRRGTLAKRSA